MLGTLGTTLSDLFRIFSGALNISPVIIGANRLSDGVFLDGLLLILTYLFTAVLYDTLTNQRPPQGREVIAVQNPESNSGMVQLRTCQVGDAHPSVRLLTRAITKSINPTAPGVSLDA